MIFGDRRRRPRLAFSLCHSCLLRRHLTLRLLFHSTGQLHPLAPMTGPIRPLQLQRPVTNLTSLLAPQARHPDLREPLRPIHPDHLSRHIQLPRRHESLPPNMYGSAHGTDLVTTRHLLGPSPRFGLLLRSSALNNLPRLLLPPHLFPPSFLRLLCQPFFLLLL